MEFIKEDAFRRQIDRLSGAYLFFGDEDYLKAHAQKSAKEAICADETFEIFNYIRIDSLDYSASSLLDALTPPPMMSEKKLVLVNGLNFNSMRGSEIDDLCDVLEALADYDYNVLIISVPAGAIDEGNIPKSPSKLLQRLAKYLTPVQFDSVTPQRLVGWLGKHFAHNGVVAEQSVCSYMVSFCGTSMFRLSNECEKLACYVKSQGSDEVRREDIDYVSSADITMDTFALANSILDGNSEGALDALYVMKFRRIEPVIILSEVSRAICDLQIIKALLKDGHSYSEIARLLKMNEYKAKLYASGAANKSAQNLNRALSLCAEADAAVKLGGGYAAIEQLICTM